jgi:tRNA(His) guanylyltransferase
MSKMNDSLGDRMKHNYENRYRFYLTRRVPVITRVDGKAFHSLPLKKPFDTDFMTTMVNAARHTAKEMQGFKLGYVQADEASFLLTDYDELETEAWFDYNLSKLISVTASTMTDMFVWHRPFFNDPVEKTLMRRYPIAFDARAFNIPESDVANYFLWRAKDWERNSVQMYCQAFFSHKQMEGQGRADQHEMLHSIGKNWTTDLTDQQKNGTFFTRTEVYYDVPPVWAEISELIQPVKPDPVIDPKSGAYGDV